MSSTFSKRAEDLDSRLDETHDFVLERWHSIEAAQRKAEAEAGLKKAKADLEMQEARVRLMQWHHRAQWHQRARLITVILSSLLVVLLSVGVVWLGEPSAFAGLASGLAIATLWMRRAR